jgi:alpha-glucosidase (family GH31 glycosyl hydrolase)
MNRILLSLLIISVISVHAQNYNPVADENAQIKIENARFTILTPRLIRIEWSEDGIFEDHASLTFVNRKLPVPKFEKNIENGILEINTGDLKLYYKINSSEFSKENLTIEYKYGDSVKIWNFGMENKGNLFGTARTLDGTNGDINININKKIELEQGIISREGWCCINDSEKPLFDNSDYPWVMPRTNKKYMDYYFFGYGYNYKQALKDYTAISGKIALPPKFIFGYWYSRYWPYTDKEMRELVNTFESFNIPLDVLVVDMDWHLTSLKNFFKDGKRVNDQANQPIGWTGFTWDANFFPEPADFLEWTNKKGIKTCLNLHPASGIQPHEEKYEEMANAVGIDPSSKKYIPFDITNKKWAKSFFDVILNPMEKDGIDFWWLDWQQWSNTAIPGVNPTFYLNYVFYSNMERKNNIRPMIYHRWGGLGNHRYQIGFSGDTQISWASLNYQPYFTSTASNVGWGYWGHDIGGHYGSIENNPELLTRWFEYGVFSPILKSHATHDEGIKRKIWEYPSQYFLIMKDYIKLRYSLIPYIYTNARYAYDESISICRPLYYEYPKSEEAYQFKNEYFFGNDIIVHPITKPIGKDSLITYQTIWLPEGKWFEWSSGTILDGGKIIKHAFTIDETPLYVKAGAIIPMQPDMKNISEKNVNPLILNIFPGEKGSTEIYDDNGDNQDFKNGKFTLTDVSFTKTQNQIKIVIEPVKGSFEGMITARKYEIRIINSMPAQKIIVNGKELNYTDELTENSWTYDGKDFAIKLLTSEFDVSEQVKINIEHENGAERIFSGKKGKIKKLALFTDFLSGKRTFWNQKIWNDAVTPSGMIIRASQTDYLVSENPKNILAELGAFDKNWNTILSMIKTNADAQTVFVPYFDLLKTNDE